MEINPNFLAHFITEQLYLVDENTESVVKPARDSDILVLIPGEISSDEMDFLKKIFSSIDIPFTRITISSEIPEMKPAFRWVFCFGIGKSGTPTYQWQRDKGKMQLTAHRLKEISDDREKKMSLWNALREASLA